ncbi:MAG: hypothetical protein K1X89_22380 [Myxococcaceae bacterium]|nr:hypothetical protein [Myxococcaceae bacterium]
MNVHLDPDSWSKLLRGQLGPAERTAVAGHLAEPCAQCEAFLEAQGPDALDAVLDAVTLGAGAPPGVTQLEAEAAGAVEAALAPPRPRARRRWAGALSGFAAGCMATAALFLALVGAPALGLRDKGHAPMPSLSAIVAVKSTDGSTQLRPLESGHAYRQSDEVFLTYQLPTESWVYLGRAGETTELFYPPSDPAAAEPEGVRPVMVDGVVHAYALSDLSGPQHLVLVTSKVPLTREQALQAVATRRLEGGSVSAVFLKVEPSR